MNKTITTKEIKTSAISYCAPFVILWTMFFINIPYIKVTMYVYGIINFIIGVLQIFFIINKGYDFYSKEISQRLSKKTLYFSSGMRIFDLQMILFWIYDMKPLFWMLLVMFIANIFLLVISIKIYRQKQKIHNLAI